MLHNFLDLVLQYFRVDGAEPPHQLIPQDCHLLVLAHGRSAHDGHLQPHGLLKVRVVE